MQRRHAIKDSDWERIQSLIPLENTGEGRPSKSNRLMLDGMLWKVKTGAPWRDLPERFGPWETVYGRFRRWNENEVFLTIFKDLSQDADLQEVSLDSPFCKVHTHAAGAKNGQNMPKPTRKSDLLKVDVTPKSMP